jgi:hypothetical protein
MSLCVAGGIQVFRGHQHIFVPYNKASAAGISKITQQRRTEPMTRRQGDSPHGRGKCSNLLRSNASQAGKHRRCIGRTQPRL